MTDYYLEDSEFDSGLLAAKVGRLHIDKPCTARSRDGLLIMEEARQKGYDLLILRSDEPVSMSGFNMVGIIDILEGRLNVVRERTGKTGGRFEIRPMEDRDWEWIRKLLPYGSPTRFSNDSRLTQDQVRKHKMALLHSSVKRGREFSLVALSNQKELIGYQFSYIAENTFVLYDLLIAPHFRTGFAAFELISENIKRLDNSLSPVEVVTTKIYSDNDNSTRLFNQIGLYATSKREFHYHLWI